MDKIQENRTVIAAAVGITVAAAGTYYLVRNSSQPPKTGPYPAERLPAGAFDAVIVGAGPSGSTAAFYLARGGAKVSWNLLGALKKSSADQAQSQAGRKIFQYTSTL